MKHHPTYNERIDFVLKNIKVIENLFLGLQEDESITVKEALSIWNISEEFEKALKLVIKEAQ